MNNLKKYAGLLNDIAPEGEFLAYINEDEAEMLKDNGALGLLTPQGIPSFFTAGLAQGDSISPGTSSTGGTREGGYGRKEGETAAQDLNTYDYNTALAAELDRQKRVKEQELAAKEKAKKEKAKKEKEQDDARLDYLTTEYLDVKLTPEQKKEYEKYRTGVRESINPSQKTSSKIISTLLNSTLFPGAGLLYKGYIDATAMGYKLKNPFENIFGGGGEISVDDVNNLKDKGDGSNATSQLIQNILKITNPNLPGSQVDQYFSNMNMAQGSPLSSDLQTSYDNAKSSVNNILGMTPANQQFGYSAQPYGSLSSTNMADNPFDIPYLQQRGLI
jgi:hypothetical protein